MDLVDHINITGVKQLEVQLGPGPEEGVILAVRPDPVDTLTAAAYHPRTVEGRHGMPDALICGHFTVLEEGTDVGVAHRSEPGVSLTHEVVHRVDLVPNTGRSEESCQVCRVAQHEHQGTEPQGSLKDAQRHALVPTLMVPQYEGGEDYPQALRAPELVFAISDREMIQYVHGHAHDGEDGEHDEPDEIR